MIRIPVEDFETTVRTGERLLGAVGLGSPAVSSVIGLVVEGVRFLQRIGKVELVEMTATEDHRMTVKP